MFSFKGLTFSISSEERLTDVASLIRTMLTYLKKKSKRVLVTIDDVSGTDNVKDFVQSYQSFIRERMDVFLLLTGLYEKVSDITNNKSLKFLLRAPKIYLSKLNIRDVALSYQEQFGLDIKDAIEIAKLTKGYAYAYQLMGDLLYRS